jgi:hypothetical protein
MSTKIRLTAFIILTFAVGACRFAATPRHVVQADTAPDIRRRCRLDAVGLEGRPRILRRGREGGLLLRGRCRGEPRRLGRAQPRDGGGEDY